MHSALLAAIFAIAVAFHPFVCEAKPVRSTAVRLEFKRHNPCPSTGLRRGSCPGFEIDHVVPLCAHGADDVSNLQWLSHGEHAIKTRGDVRQCRALRHEEEKDLVR